MPFSHIDRSPSSFLLRLSSLFVLFPSLQDHDFKYPTGVVTCGVVKIVARYLNVDPSWHWSCYSPDPTPKWECVEEYGQKLCVTSDYRGNATKVRAGWVSGGQAAGFVCVVSDCMGNATKVRDTRIEGKGAVVQTVCKCCGGVRAQGGKMNKSVKGG